MHAFILQCLATHMRMNPPKYHSQTLPNGINTLHCFMIPPTIIQRPAAINAADNSPKMMHPDPQPAIICFAI